ncbi:hypothetical protein [Bdellovibrio sp. HCB2-146]|uniref:hypothetical protein n=1 Tax=Bdellovibrio sp. HCB2-146 TaxID=3394362 RepID=UPI0039BD6CFD
MKSIIALALILGAFTVHALDAKAVTNKSQEISAKAKKGKNEPAPRDRDERQGGGDEKDPREETYEGNDRDEGGSFDGGGYTGGGEGGGFLGEIFNSANGGKTYPTQMTTKVEDRGDVLVYLTTIQEDISATETCVTTVVTVVDKASGKTLQSDSDRFCNVIAL